ncbi:hypothetical protein RA307_01355 [Xanthobacteraceae bacterium Astr-EGSB]|uniref:hypothetical protein n=1 Tax=Astrobacterium formosum TaxID=3069710 RepID=UPI0027B2D9F0|nr:hypothetical protein [Xanthobacteraceae bacterium Astr-EGSB]
MVRHLRRAYGCTSVPPYDDEFSGEPSPSMNLVPPLLGLIVIGLIVYLVSVMEPADQPAASDFSICASLTDRRERLTCYDQLTKPPSPAKGALAPFGSQAGESP